MSKLYFSAIAIVALASSSAEAQGIVADATIGSIADNLTQNVQSIIGSLDNTVSSNSFKMRQQLEIILGQIDTVANGQRDKLFSQLDNTEQKSITDMQNSITQLSQTADKTLQDVNNTSNVVGVSISNLPFAKSAPRVTQYNPSYIVSGSTSIPGFQEIEIKGLLLSAGSPSLTLGGAKCSLDTKIDTSLKFSCPASGWAAPTVIRDLSGDLTLYQKKGFWSSLFGSNKFLIQPYKVSLFVVPHVLGKYRVDAVIQTTVPTPHAQSQFYDDKNSHCNGGHDREFTFNVTNAAWIIDQASIVPNCKVFGNSSCEGTVDIGPKSFGIKAHIENSGSCGPKIPFTSQRTFLDSQGEVNGTVQWTEISQDQKNVSATLDSGPLEWNKSVPVNLPAGAQNVVVTIDQIDGRHSVLVNSTPNEKWFGLNINMPGNIVVISPKDVDSALSM